MSATSIIPIRTSQCSAHFGSLQPNPAARPTFAVEQRKALSAHCPASAALAHLPPSPLSHTKPPSLPMLLLLLHSHSSRLSSRCHTPAPAPASLSAVPGRRCRFSNIAIIWKFHSNQIKNWRLPFYHFLIRSQDLPQRCLLLCAFYTRVCVRVCPRVCVCVRECGWGLLSVLAVAARLRHWPRRTAAADCGATLFVGLSLFSFFI